MEAAKIDGIDDQVEQTSLQFDAAAEGLVGDIEVIKIKADRCFLLQVWQGQAYRRRVPG